MKENTIIKSIVAGNIVAFFLIIFVYFCVFGSLQISFQSNDWLFFFEFIIKPMTFIVAVSALIISYLNFTISKKKYDQDHKQTELTRVLKIMEDIYPRYITLKNKYESEYNMFLQELADLQNQRQLLGGNPEMPFITDEEFKKQWYPYKKTFIDMVSCQLTAFNFLEQIKMDSNISNKLLIRHYSYIFDYDYSDQNFTNAIKLQLENQISSDLVDFLEIKAKLNKAEQK